MSLQQLTPLYDMQCTLVDSPCDTVCGIKFFKGEDVDINPNATEYYKMNQHLYKEDMGQDMM